MLSLLNSTKHSKKKEHSTGRDISQLILLSQFYPDMKPSQSHYAKQIIGKHATGTKMQESLRK